MNVCPRCCKSTNGVHTCTPTDAWDAPYNDGYETAKAEFRKEIVAVEEQLATAQAKIAELESALMNSGLIIESLHVREVKSSRNEMVRLAAEALAQTEVK